jgi:hypothetical protein
MDYAKYLRLVVVDIARLRRRIQEVKSDKRGVRLS